LVVWQRLRLRGRSRRARAGDAVVGFLGSDSPELYASAPIRFSTPAPDESRGLGLRYAMPTIFGFREFPAAGGLMSYGGNVVDAHRWLGVYAGRILKGERPSDLPLQQATKIDLIINLKTAKALGLSVPPALLLRADELIGRFVALSLKLERTA
jgi:hypothetical protein